MGLGLPQSNVEASATFGRAEGAKAAKPDRAGWKRYSHEMIGR